MERYTANSPEAYTVDLDLRQLRVFEVLLRERNLTRAATGLGVSQPALSKTLAGMRRLFRRPAVHPRRPPHGADGQGACDRARGSLAARPGDDAARGPPAVRPEDVVTDLQLQRRRRGDDPLDAAAARDICGREAPGVRLRVVPVDMEGLEGVLESGYLDFAMGSFRDVVEEDSTAVSLVRNLRQRRARGITRGSENGRP